MNTNCLILFLGLQFLHRCVQSSEISMCPRGYYFASNKCELVPRGYILNDQNELQVCKYSLLPGASYCNHLQDDTVVKRNCDVGYYYRTTTTTTTTTTTGQYGQCIRIPSGYFNPHSNQFNVYYICPYGLTSSPDSTTCYNPHTRTLYTAEDLYTSHKSYLSKSNIVLSELKDTIDLHVKGPNSVEYTRENTDHEGINYIYDSDLISRHMQATVNTPTNEPTLIHRVNYMTLRPTLEPTIEPTDAPHIKSNISPPTINKATSQSNTMLSLNSATTIGWMIALFIVILIGVIVLYLYLLRRSYKYGNTLSSTSSETPLERESYDTGDDTHNNHMINIHKNYHDSERNNCIA